MFPNFLLLLTTVIILTISPTISLKTTKKILAIGDSITSGYTWGYTSAAHDFHSFNIALNTELKKNLPSYEVVKYGLDCTDTVNMPDLYKGYLNERKWDMSLMWFGANDVHKYDGRSAAYIANRIIMMHKESLKKGMKVVVIALPQNFYDFNSSFQNSKRLEINKHFYAFAAKYKNVILVDLSKRWAYGKASGKERAQLSDGGMHWTPKGYDMMGKYMGEQIVKAMKDQYSITKDIGDSSENYVYHTIKDFHRSYNCGMPTYSESTWPDVDDPKPDKFPDQPKSESIKPVNEEKSNPIPIAKEVKQQCFNKLESIIGFMQEEEQSLLVASHATNKDKTKCFNLNTYNQAILPIEKNLTIIENNNFDQISKKLTDSLGCLVSIPSKFNQTQFIKESVTKILNQQTMLKTCTSDFVNHMAVTMFKRRRYLFTDIENQESFGIKNVTNLKTNKTEIIDFPWNNVEVTNIVENFRMYTECNYLFHKTLHSEFMSLINKISSINQCYNQRGIRNLKSTPLQILTCSKILTDDKSSILDKSKCSSSMNESCRKNIDLQCKKSGLHQYLNLHPVAIRKFSKECTGELVSTPQQTQDCFNWIKKTFILGSMTLNFDKVMNLSKVISDNQNQVISNEDRKKQILLETPNAIIGDLSEKDQLSTKINLGELNKMETVKEADIGIVILAAQQLNKDYPLLMNYGGSLIMMSYTMFIVLLSMYI